MSISGDKYKENLKHAAEFLLKGGTLLSESCEKCNGIQVKKNNVITCIICENKTTVEEPKPTKDIDKTVQPGTGISMSEKIGKRLGELIMSVGSDKNLDEEEQRLRVIDNYIKILEKIKFFELNLKSL
ncbi:MAG TPA: autoantigen p27 domain-containing protein [Nitrososphaeraceae archaeon]